MFEVGVDFNKFEKLWLWLHNIMEVYLSSHYVYVALETQTNNFIDMGQNI